MKKKNKKLFKKINHGFSLMETIIWVSIVAIFGGIIGFSAAGYLSNAKVTAAKQELNIFSTALLQYYEMEGSYPSDSDGLSALIKNDLLKVKNANDITDPWKTPYEYTSTNDGQGFTLKSLGSDKKEGGNGTKTDLIISGGDANESSEDEFDYGNDFKLND